MNWRIRKKRDKYTQFGSYHEYRTIHRKMVTEINKLKKLPVEIDHGDLWKEVNMLAFKLSFILEMPITIAFRGVMGSAEWPPRLTYKRNPIRLISEMEDES